MGAATALAACSVGFEAYTEDRAEGASDGRVRPRPAGTSEDAADAHKSASAKPLRMSSMNEKISRGRGVEEIESGARLWKK